MSSVSVPHIWFTQDGDECNCRHLAMSQEGAIQAHLLHHGMIGYNGTIDCVDEGVITHNTDRGEICFDPLCVLYGLSFPRGE